MPDRTGTAPASAAADVDGPGAVSGRSWTVTIPAPTGWDVGVDGVGGVMLRERIAVRRNPLTGAWRVWIGERTAYYCCSWREAVDRAFALADRRPVPVVGAGRRRVGAVPADAVIRQWAAAHGVPCPGRGRVPYRVVDAYMSASGP